ncbi:MAG: hypothetical protein SWK76_00950 [Actinomycetota bacterium]|nr:hypothetical protein [Actinomycetota bacterium]
MKATRTCGECGVPLGVARTLDWNANGTITQKKDPRHRMILFESDNLDRLWSRLSELLGVTLKHVSEIVIESKSRATRAFLSHTLPWHVNLLAHFIGYRTMISSIEAQGLVMGYGKITVGGQYPERGRPERITVFVEDPYSLPLFCGDFKGAAEVMERRPAGITYQALDARRHQVDVTMGRERLEEESFKWTEEARAKPGGMEYRRCLTCGTPLELQRFTWDLEAGIIRERETGRRMALFGSASLLAVFDELAHELGERVTGDIIGVERENAVAAMSSEEAASGFEALRSMAALRGLGSLNKLDLDPGGLTLRMSNPSIPPYILGLALGVFELATGRYGEYEWAIEEDGDLLVDITP